MAMTDDSLPSSIRATAREWAGLVLLALPMMALATDLTVLFFALPTISADLAPSATQSLWITHVYGFLIAGFLVTAGRVADRVGPRRVLLMGSAAFAGLSVMAAFSTSAEMLIAARAALGIAGASLMPSLFSLLRTMFQEETQRRTAIAIMFSTFTVGGAVGPLLGGVLLESFLWGSVFLINVPPIVLLLLGGLKLLPERTERNRSRIDMLSVALSVAGMLAIIFGFQELAVLQETGDGVAWPYLLSIGLGAGVMTLFVLRQRRLAEPLFDLALLRSRGVAVSLGVLLMMGVSVTGMFYLFTQHLQWVGGLSPLHGAFWTLPYIGLNIVGAMLAPRAAQRFSAGAVTLFGLLVAAGGACGLALTTGLGSSVAAMAVGIAVVGLGQGAAGALIVDLIISSAPEEKTGSAASAQEIGGELGSALGIAAGGVVALLAYQVGMADVDVPGAPRSVVETARHSVHEGVSAAQHLTVGGGQLLEQVRDAFSLGQVVYAGLGAAVLMTSAILLLVSRRARRGSVTEAAAPSDSR